MKKVSLVGIYAHVDELLDVINRVKEKKPDKMVVYSPIPIHEVQDALKTKRSPVRYFTLAGAFTGFFGGFALSIWSSMKWNLITGGKPVVTIVPFVVIAFELTILLGAIATIVGLIIMNQFPNYRIANTYEPAFSRDKFGLAVQIKDTEKKAYEELFQLTGAEAINVR